MQRTRTFSSTSVFLLMKSAITLKSSPQCLLFVKTTVCSWQFISTNILPLCCLTAVRESDWFMLAKHAFQLLKEHMHPVLTLARLKWSAFVYSTWYNPILELISNPMLIFWNLVVNGQCSDFKYLKILIILFFCRAPTDQQHWSDSYEAYPRLHWRLYSDCILSWDRA